MAKDELKIIVKEMNRIDDPEATKLIKKYIDVMREE